MLRRQILTLVFAIFIINIMMAQTDKNEIRTELLIQAQENITFINKDQNYTSKQLSSSPNIWHFIYPNEAEATIAKRQFEKQSTIEYIQYNHLLEWRTTPNDPRYQSDLQWNLDLIGATTAWDYTTGGLSPNGDTIVVAVIDNGCDLQHEDLSENIWHNHAEIPNNNIDDDNNGWIDDYNGWNPVDENDTHALEVHGTSVASIIGAKGNNNKGIAGINWNVKLMILSSDDVDLITEANAVEAYAYVLEARRRYNQSGGLEGAFVVATNASFGINSADATNYPIWCGMYDALGAEGVLNVAATANADVDVDEVGDMPTTCGSDYLVAVTQTTESDNLHPSAAYGVNHIDIGAPGTVFAARPNNTYNLFGGTSGASPHVAGAIGLLYAHSNSLWGEMMIDDPAEAALLLKSILIQTAYPLMDLESKSQSEGRLDLGKAMFQLDEYFKTPTTTDILNVYPNPVIDEFNIKLSLAEEITYELKIYDALGRLNYAETLTPNRARIYTHIIQVEDWAQGIYFIQLDADQERYITKMIKN